MFIHWFSIKLLWLSLQNLFVFLIGYNLQWETPRVVFSMVGRTGPTEKIPQLLSYPFKVQARPLNPKLCSWFLSCISPPIFCPSPPIYTPLSVGQSWWRNLWYVNWSFHSQGLGGFLSLDHNSPVSYHVSKRGPTFCHWDNPSVTCAQRWILCFVGEFSQANPMFYGRILPSHYLKLSAHTCSCRKTHRGEIPYPRCFLTLSANISLLWAEATSRSGPNCLGDGLTPFGPPTKIKSK